MSEVGELRSEIDRMNARLTALEPKRTDVTIVTHRTAEAWRRRMITVGIASSLATAVFMIGLYAMVTLMERPPAPPPVVVEPPRPPPTLPPIQNPPPQQPPEIVAEKPVDPAPDPSVKPVEPTRRLPPLERNPYDPNGGATSNGGSVAANDSAKGGITVICIPRCDSIVENGEPLGAGHIFGHPVPPGRHTILLHAPNGVAKSITVDVKSGETKEVRMSMDSVSGGPKPSSGGKSATDYM